MSTATPEARRRARVAYIERNPEWHRRKRVACARRFAQRYPEKVRHYQLVRSRTFGALKTIPQTDAPLFLAHKESRVMLGVSGSPAPRGWTACAVIVRESYGWRVSAPLTLRTVDTDGKTILAAARCWARKQVMP